MILKAINMDGYYHTAPVVSVDPETKEESTAYYTIPLSRTILRSKDGEYDEFTHVPDNEVDKNRITESASFKALNEYHLQAVDPPASRRAIVVCVADGEGGIVDDGTLEEYIQAGKDTSLILDAKGPGVYFVAAKQLPVLQDTGLQIKG